MKKIILLFICAGFSLTVSAQKVAIKNNLLYDAALTPNIGLEFATGRMTTLDIGFNYNPFKFDNGSLWWKHWLVQPELRFWTCDRFNGGFWGIHALGGEYSWNNVKLPFGIADQLRGNRFEGWFVGGGVSYGYHWILSDRWSLEATIGVGYARIYYKKYSCDVCSPVIGEGYANYFGPTRLGLSFIFLL